MPFDTELQQPGPAAADGYIDPPFTGMGAGGMAAPGPGFLYPEDPQLPIYLNVSPTDIPQAFKDEALDYASAVLGESYRFMRRKTVECQDTIKLLRNEYQLWELFNLDGVKDKPSAKQQAIRANYCQYVEPIFPIIRQESAVGFRSILSGPDWITVVNEDFQAPADTPAQSQTNQDTDQPTGTQRAPQYTTEKKLTKYLCWAADQGFIRSEIHRSLLHFNALPAVFARVHWDERKAWVRHREFTIDSKTGTSRDRMGWHEQTIRARPRLSVIHYDRILPDPAATNCDVNSHRFVGEWDYRWIHDARERFRSGKYLLGEKEFKAQWGEEDAGSSAPTDRGPLGDSDAETVIDSGKLGELKEWTAHMIIPSKHFKRNISCFIQILTDDSAETPDSGVLVNLTTEPLLDSGEWPYVCATRMPLEMSIFGISHPQEMRAVQAQQSQLVAQLVDGAKFTATPIIVGDPGDVDRLNTKYDGVIPPGAILSEVEKGTLRFLSPPALGTADLLASVQYFSTKLEASGATGAFMGVTPPERSTATGDTIRQQQSAAPSEVSISCFVQTFIERAMNLELQMLVQYQQQPMSVAVPEGNQWATVKITPDELRSGRYSVKCTLTNQDAMSTVRVQNLQSLLEQAPMLNEMLAPDRRINPGEIVYRILDENKTPGAERVLEQIGDREQMLMMQLTDQENYIAGLEAQLQGAPPQGQEPPSEAPPQPQPSPDGYGANGGPMGDLPMDQNAMAQALQMQAQAVQGDPNAL